jgi:hypothetical protein
LNTLPNEWGLVISSVADGTRPAAAWGTTITPGNNVFGSYVQVLPATSDETFLIRITITGVGVVSTAKDCLVTIGIDPAGGTSYVDTIVNLLASCAPNYHSTLPGPTEYEFPLRIPAGASLAAKASVNNATVGTAGVAITLWGRPSRPDLVKAGTFVTTFGANTAASNGTAITVGTTAEGAWTQIGAALTTPLFYWEFGFGANNATLLATSINVDLGLGDASNKKVVISNAFVGQTTSETISKPAAGRVGLGAIGDIVYIRAQAGPGAPDASSSVIAYGVGG